MNANSVHTQKFHHKTATSTSLSSPLEREIVRDGAKPLNWRVMLARLIGRSKNGEVKSTCCHKGNTGRQFEIRLWLTILFLINLGLLFGNTPATNLLYDPSAIANGEWWRLLSWPFVHVSRYHLLLDGTAFLMLYSSLEEKRVGVRLSYVAISALGSLLLPLAIAPQINNIGLCGLSGIAHGLMAISALEMLEKNNQKKLGLIMLLGLLGKTGWELWSGSAFLHNLHFGNIGQPIVATHAGGVMAGFSIFILQKWHQIVRNR